MRRPAVGVLVLLLVLFVALPAGLLLYAATRPCPEMWLSLVWRGAARGHVWHGQPGRRTMEAVI